MYQTKMEIIVAIVDDHPVVMEGLRKILVSDLHVKEVLQYGTAHDFISFVESNPNAIDLVLLDITLPDKNGVEVCKEVKVLSPRTRVLGFSNHSERSLIMQMLHNGANGYILKNATAAELVDCIQEALNGQLVFSKEVKEIISRPSLRELNTVPTLTRREKQILHMIANGQTSIEISEELHISPLTVESHRRNLMQKFDAKNVASLIKIATQHQLL
jgi:DNA-binding NarL/FixJ family response regulator